MKSKKFVILIICFFIVAFLYGCNAFSVENWKNYPDSRYKMIDSLEKQFNLVGMSGQEIVELLGEPYDIWEYDYDGSYYELYHYYIGPSYTFDNNIYEIIVCNGVVTGMHTYAT